MAARKKSKDPVLDLQKQISKLTVQLNNARNKKLTAAKKAVSSAEAKAKKATDKLASLTAKSKPAAKGTKVTAAAKARMAKAKMAVTAQRAEVSALKELLKAAKADYALASAEKKQADAMAKMELKSGAKKAPGKTKSTAKKAAKKKAAKKSVAAKVPAKTKTAAKRPATKAKETPASKVEAPPKAKPVEIKTESPIPAATTMKPRPAPFKEVKKDESGGGSKPTLLVEPKIAAVLSPSAKPKPEVSDSDESKIKPDDKKSEGGSSLFGDN